MITFPSGREIILGIGAGIAAYKSCDLLRRLQEDGFSVTVVPTENSLSFVGRTTWEGLSGKPAPSNLWDSNGGVAHVDLAKRADLIVVSPATADLIARISLGRADDLLTTTILASKAPLIIVPAMHPEMYLNPATQDNLATLKRRGIYVMNPDFGKLTSGDEGIGRLPENLAIREEVTRVLARTRKLKDRRILITAGGTREAIDPVRFIGNRSSGRQGLEIAFEARREGADVTLIAGQTEEFELPGVRTIRVESALEMKSELEKELPINDALIMTAAVADARPSRISNGKISKSELTEITLIENPDLLATAAGEKKKNQIFVGFAAETESDFRDRGRKKLHQKEVDYLFVTDIANGKVFGEPRTSGLLISKGGVEWPFLNSTKSEVARSIIDKIADDFALMETSK
jgi:phosphopantothenoylcysteine decarboxylase/phosphopantothenate--cysteine ligase